MMTPEFYWTARTIMLEFFTTMGGLMIPVENLNEVCKANAAGVRTTLMTFYVVSIEHEYNDESNCLIIGALVLATLEQFPVHLKVFLEDTKNFKTRF